MKFRGPDAAVFAGTRSGLHSAELDADFEHIIELMQDSRPRSFSATSKRALAVAKSARLKSAANSSDTSIPGFRG